MTNLWLVLERLLLATWVGGMVAVGFVVTPVLFRMLDDRMLAGNIAGELFGILSKFGLLCGAILLALAITRSHGDWFRAWRVWVLTAMLLIVLVAEYGLLPAMKEIKQSVGTALIQGTEAYRQFSRLHRVSSILFLLNTSLGLVLVSVGVTSR
ncbi:MAG: DUF4149 domain-containing protein [Gammaproteobacteria bacterium]|nr:DUF4149 domain-containing protein [Gammaproteobacteria bacterium]